MIDPIAEAQAALDATPYMEGGTATSAAIDRLIAAHAAKLVADAAVDADRYKTAGAFRIAQPAPVLELPEPPPIPLELPEQSLRLPVTSKRPSVPPRVSGSSIGFPACSAS